MPENHAAIELFRFALLRSPEQMDEANRIAIDGQSPFLSGLRAARASSEPGRQMKEAANTFAAGDAFVTSAEQVPLGTQLAAFHAAVMAGEFQSLEGLDASVGEHFTGQSAADLVQSGDFQTAEARVTDSLIASSIAVPPRDRSKLTVLAQALALIRAVARREQRLDKKDGARQFLSIPITLPKDLFPVPAAEATAASTTTQGAEDLETSKAWIERAIVAIANLTPSDLRLSDREIPDDDRNVGDTLGRREQRPRELTITDEALERLGREVIAVLQSLGIDPHRTGVPEMAAGLTKELNRINAHLIAAGYFLPLEGSLVRVGNNYYPLSAIPSILAAQLGGGAPVPALAGLHGTIRPVGIADLLSVRQRVVGYERGEVAHIENVLTGEALVREVRRSELSEETITEETERVQEEQRDLQTTERFEMREETQNELRAEGKLASGNPISPDYGPVLEFTESTDIPVKGSETLAKRKATDFSKEVTSRAVSRVADRTRRVVTRRTVREFEEKNRHSFENPAPNDNIVGVYQWVEKVQQAQIFSYGKRLMYDITIPEPAAFYIFAQQNNFVERRGLVKPPPFTIQPQDVTPDTYQKLAGIYLAANLNPPPARELLVSEGFAEAAPGRRADREEVRCADPVRL